MLYISHKRSWQRPLVLAARVTGKGFLQPLSTPLGAQEQRWLRSRASGQAQTCSLEPEVGSGLSVVQSPDFSYVICECHVSTTLATQSETILGKKNQQSSGQQEPSGCQPALRALGLGHVIAEKPQRGTCQSSLRVSGQPLMPGFQSAPCRGQTGTRNHAGSEALCLDGTAGLSQSQALEGT